MKRAPQPVLSKLDRFDGFEPAQRNGRMLPPLDPDVVETVDGIALYRHPELLLDEDPELAGHIAMLRVVGPAPLTREDYLTRSARDIEGWQTVLATRARALRQPVKEEDEGDE